MNTVFCRRPGTVDSPHMSASYLNGLNPDQRRAVEYGVGQSNIAGPLLVIAGAGSGKTNTLAHRVAHLIVNGADPRRILLMTFSRRAAGEMSRRVERIASAALGVDASAAALDWSGTFHGIGARLLREYATHIGLNPAFTIHDREDSADLMDLVRHELGSRKPRSVFRRKEPASQSTRARSTRRRGRSMSSSEPSLGA